MHGTVRLLLEIAICWLSSVVDENCASRSRHLSLITLFVYNILIWRFVEAVQVRLRKSIFRILYLTYHGRDYVLVSLTSNSKCFVLTISRISPNPPIQQAWLFERSWSTTGYSRYLSIKKMQPTAIAPHLCCTFQLQNILRSCRTDMRLTSLQSSVSTRSAYQVYSVNGRIHSSLGHNIVARKQLKEKKHNEQNTLTQTSKPLNC